MTIDERPRSGKKRNMGSSIMAESAPMLGNMIMSISISIWNDDISIMEMINNIIHGQDNNAEMISSVHCQSNIHDDDRKTTFFSLPN
eukprot:CAMPEP_0201975198 /NCGR_PEP_ID=MMETSP0904-20121228/53203_1 /ASSEMBLY_ACC=CAM_ASM_000553 /TAXON_ID=420261 /ORGANISM="Thalassiosira antarctica, Strain CCMP982" /LENGTH=86 /DNA_ID=CAMNT_0048525919 /DNA_START=224 /DNA_END=481 /DNA_ORIENTATION=+